MEEEKVIKTEIKPGDPGNPFHEPAGAPDGKGGQFTSGPKGTGSEQTEPSLSVSSKKRLSPGLANKLRGALSRIEKEKEVPTLKEFYSHRFDVIERIKRDQNVSFEMEEKVRRACEKPFKEMVDKGLLCKFAKVRHAISILQDGKMKNGFETGHGDGAESWGFRVKISSDMFGHKILDAKNPEAKSFEKYGCLVSGNVETFFNEGASTAYYCTDDSWGDGDSIQVAFILKKSNMLNRTTASVGDTLNVHSYSGNDYSRGNLPKKITQPFDIYQFNKYSKNWIRERSESEIARAIESTKDNPFAFCRKFLTSNGEYLELQYHGEVTTPDFNYILLRFPERINFDFYINDQHKELIKLAQQQGLRVIGGGPGNKKAFELSLDKDNKIVYNELESEVLPND